MLFFLNLCINCVSAGYFILTYNKLKAVLRRTIWEACSDLAAVVIHTLSPNINQQRISTTGIFVAFHEGGLMKNGMIECSVCHSKLVSPSTKTISRAYDRHRIKVSSKQRALNFLLVGGDCVLVGLQPILVFMSKVDGRFNFSPISVNFLTEVAKVIFAIVMLIFQARRQKVGEKPLLSISTFTQAARNNVLLAVPALLYAINNYLKFVMQLYFNPATVKMLSNLKVLVIAVLLRIIMRRRFSIIQWEALALLLIGISINQLKSYPDGTTALGLAVTTGAYVYTLIFVTVPSLASVFNEYALKSQYDTSIYLQNLFLYGYGAIFNFLGILGTAIFKGPSSFDILEGHSKATMLLICNNAAQGILSSFFFKYADTILKKYSSTVATIFTGIASAALFGHTLTINFMLGISVVFISMHQFFSPLSKAKEDLQNGVVETVDVQDNHRSKDSSFINIAAGANEEASHRVGPDERQPLLPT
ncbi:UDP-galactose transporter [Striga asiatica]|uniref:UDP-galactose transporter n=1 Tax=Striga asiatica TaxID=4170 RepID=A0A5A7P4Q2_STRAF|nr:UDP-galactose transporter [Striga asiatica]